MRRWAGHPIDGHPRQRRGLRQLRVALLPILVLAGVGPGAGRSTGPRDRQANVAAATVTVYGRDDGFGALGDRLPSGQRLARVAVPDWRLPSGWQAHASAVAADGTVVVAGRPAEPADGRTATAGPVLAVFDRRTNQPTTLRPPGAGGRSPVIDLEPVGDGVAALIGAGPSPGGTDGAGATVGLVTRVDGRWRMSAPAALAGACGRAACPDPGEVAAVSGSRDLLVTWPADRRGNGSIAAIRLTGPDEAGRLAAAVVARYTYPRVPDPVAADPDDRLSVSPAEIHVDREAGAGPRRLAVRLDVRRSDGQAEPSVLQEFGYDARAGAIRPLSAPILAGDRVPDLARRPTDVYYAFGTSAYDRHGNLWVARNTGLAGGRLAVYVRGPGRATIGGPGCAYRPDRPPEADVTRVDGRTVWGRTCRPDYDILQTAAFHAMEGIAVDPTTGDVVCLMLGGVVLVIRATGSDRDMRFTVGNVVDLGLKLLPGQPDAIRREWLAGIDADHRMWLVSSYFDGSPGADHWLFSVRLGDLLDPPPVELSDTPGRLAVVQAEQTLSTGTTRRAGDSGRVAVDSEAFVASCLTWGASNDCGHDLEPGDGLLVRDDTGFGHLTGELLYRIRVPAAGRYRPVFRVSTFANLPNSRIELTVAGQTVTTAVPPLGRWTTAYADDPIDLPAGLHVVRLEPPPRGGGWALNWFGLERL
jgi:hypothetical protein